MQTQFVAHRGLQPENTLYAFKQAFAQGFKVAECDVHVTCDGEFVVCHDNTLQRTALSASPYLQQAIATLNYAQIAAVAVGDQYHQEPLPRLVDLLALLPQDVTLLIEIKFQQKAAISSFLKLIQPYLHKVILISFNLALLTAIRQQQVDSRILLLTSATSDAYRSVVVNDELSLQQAILLLQQYQLQGLGLQYSNFITPYNLQPLTSHYLSQLWYNERNAVQVEHIIKQGQAAAVQFINVD